jgi:hypothetical protein
VAKVVNIVWVLKAMAYEVCALADDRLAYLAWSLARDNERNSEFPALFRNSFETQA